VRNEDTIKKQTNKKKNMFEYIIVIVVVAYIAQRYMHYRLSTCIDTTNARTNLNVKPKLVKI
jgi:hypothetical protein